MPLLVHCDSCDSKLRVGDHMVGKMLRCPTCGSRMIIAEIEASDERSEPRRPAARKRTSRSVVRDDFDDESEEMDFKEQPARRKRRKRRRSGGDSVGAILVRVIIVLIVVGVVGGAGYLGYRVLTQLSASSVPASAWQPLSPPGAGFTVQLPGSPKQAGNNPNQYSLDLGQTFYLVRHDQIAPRAPVNFDAGIQTIVNLSAGTVTSSTDFNLGPWKGKTFEADVIKPFRGHLVGRFVIANNREILLMVVGTKMKADSPDVIKFFDSLQLDGK